MSSIPVTTTCYSPSVSVPTPSVSQATSHGQVVVGTGVNFNIASPVLHSFPVLPNLISPGGTSALSPITIHIEIENQADSCMPVLS